MCIIKIQKRNTPFTQIDKRCSENSALSLKAKGMLSYLLGKPDDWKIRMSDLIKNNADGEVSIRSTLKELEKNGHLKKQRTTKVLGFIPACQST
jgi:hypothetical protein